MTLCPQSSVNVNGNGGSAGAAGGWETVYEYNFADEATANLANGQVVLADGTSWTVANSASAATWRFLNGTGIDFVANATNTAWNSAPAFTANVLWISLNDPTLIAARQLIPDYDMSRQYMFQIRNQANNGNAAAEMVMLHLWAPAAVPYSTATDRTAGAVKGGNAIVAGGTGVAAQAAVSQLIASYSGDDVICTSPCVSQPSAIACASGVYGATWPAMSALRECGWLASTGVPATAISPNRYNDPSMRLAIVFATGNGSATFAAQVERIRVLARL